MENSANFFTIFEKPIYITLFNILDNIFYDKAIDILLARYSVIPKLPGCETLLFFIQLCAHCRLLHAFAALQFSSIFLIFFSFYSIHVNFFKNCIWLFDIT